MDYKRGTHRLKMTGLTLMICAVAPICLGILFDTDVVVVLVVPCVVTLLLGASIFIGAWIWDGFLGSGRDT